MPLNPPPVIDANLGLVTQEVQFLAGFGHTSVVTFALDCGGEDLPTAQDSIDDFFANITAHIAPTYDSGIAFPPPTIKLGNGGTVPVEAVAAGTTVSGSATVSWDSANIAALVKKSTGLGGKQNRGRTYWPYLVPSAHIVEPGLIDSAELPGLQTIMTNFFNQLTTDGTPMVIANKLFNQPLAPHHVVRIQKGPVVTSYVLEQTLATQRRRLRS